MAELIAPMLAWLAAWCLLLAGTEWLMRVLRGRW